MAPLRSLQQVSWGGEQPQAISASSDSMSLLLLVSLVRDFRSPAMLSLIDRYAGKVRDLAHCRITLTPLSCSGIHWNCAPTRLCFPTRLAPEKAAWAEQRKLLLLEQESFNNLSITIRDYWM